MSDTPRTEIQISSGYRFTEETGVREYVPANFARELERENAKLREELESLWTAATDFRRVPINAAFLATLTDKLESAHKLLLRTPKP